MSATHFFFVAARMVSFLVIVVFATRYLSLFYFVQLLIFAPVFLYRDLYQKKKMSENVDFLLVVDLFIPGGQILIGLIKNVVGFLGEAPPPLLENSNDLVRVQEKNESIYLTGDVSDFVGQIKYGDKNQKLRVMEEISKDPKEEMLNLLHMAMADKEYEVRYYANNLILKIEANIISAIKSLSEYIVKNPSDEESYLKRAQLYEKLALLNQNENHAYNLYLDKAQEDYAITMTINTPMQETYFKVIEIFGKRRQYEMALRYFNILKSMKMDIPENSPVHQTILEARFQLGV